MQRTRPEIVERRIALVADTPLSQTEMFETQRNLYDLGIFSKVDVALQNPGGAEDAKNVLLQVEEARRWAVGFGGGAEFARIGRNTAELTNPVGNAVFSPRATLELTRLNMLGKAHMMSFRTRFSALQQRGLFTYQAPRWFDSDRWALTLSGLFDTSRNVNTFTGRRIEGALQFTQQLNRATTVLYRYAYRRTAIDENTLHIEPLLVPADFAARAGRAAVGHLHPGPPRQSRRFDQGNIQHARFESGFRPVGLAARFFFALLCRTARITVSAAAPSWPARFNSA